MEPQPVSSPNTPTAQSQFSGTTPTYPTPSSKNESLLILLVIFLIFLSLFSGLILGKYLYGQGVKPPTTEVFPTTAQPTIGETFFTSPPPATITPDLTADWKTYTSVGKYSFKYPAHWNVTENKAPLG